MPRDPKFQSALVTVRELRKRLERTLTAFSCLITIDTDSDERGDDIGFLPDFCPTSEIRSQVEEVQTQARLLLQQEFRKMDYAHISTHETNLSAALRALAPIVIKYIECKMQACKNLRDEVHRNLLFCRKQIDTTTFSEPDIDRVESLFDEAFYYLRDFQKAISEEERKPAAQRDWLRLKLTGWEANDTAADLEEFIERVQGGNDDRSSYRR